MMSYRNPNQSLSGPIFDISAGIDSFAEAVLERIKSGEWENSHTVEITRLANELRYIQAQLLMLEQRTW